MESAANVAAKAFFNGDMRQVGTENAGGAARLIVLVTLKRKAVAGRVEQAEERELKSAVMKMMLRFGRNLGS